MSGDRSEAAVQRIEAALARIARAADAPSATAAPSANTNVLALVEKHESLREKVARAIAELDDVIAGRAGDDSPKGASAAASRTAPSWLPWVIAGLLARWSQALILDEPLAGLDADSQRGLLRLLTDLRINTGLTVVVISHDFTGLEELCPRILHLNGGVLS